MEGINNKDLAHYNTPTYVNMIKAAIDYSDALIIGSENINSDVTKHMKKANKPILDYQGEETYLDTCSDFYTTILEEGAETS